MFQQTVAHFEPEQWQLKDLFVNLNATDLEDAIGKFQADLSQFVAKRGLLSDTLPAAQFLEMLNGYTHLVAQSRLMYAFATLNFSADTQDQGNQANIARAQQLNADFRNQTLFFLLWWQGLAPEEVDAYIEAAPQWRYWLTQLRNATPYTLSEAEEKINNIKNVNGSQALLRLYSSLTNRYQFELEIDGELKRLTREELSAFYRHADANVREQAYRSLFANYSADETVLGQIYQALVRDWYSENVDVRGYDAAISVRNTNNDLPDEVVDVLLQVTREQAGVFQRYFRLRAQMLGSDTLSRFDLAAPIGDTTREVSYQEAIEMVMRGFSLYDEELADLAHRIFADHHYDGEVRAGKRGGAFCLSPGPGITPYILHSFTGRMRDVSTMAHELGHAIHALLAAHHNVLSFHASLPLAETASTFAEMLVMDMLITAESDPETERALLMEQLDGAYATIIRQAEFARFEVIAHEMIRNGATVDEISARYLTELKIQYGDAVDVDEIFRYEWVAIPHFYSVPFYVYAYAFGQLLVLALYRQYKLEGESFKPRFREILAAGGSAAPAEILMNAGIDVRSADFWRGGFAVLEEMIGRLEYLTG